MEPVSLWAAVEFTACNGSTEALLTAAARAGLHPYGVTALPGGWSCRVAVPAPCRAGPQAPGAAAHPPEAGAVFLPAPLAAPGRALLEKFLDTLSAFGERENINFTITITADPSGAGDGLKKYF